MVEFSKGKGVGRIRPRWERTGQELEESRGPGIGHDQFGLFNSTMRDRRQELGLSQRDLAHEVTEILRLSGAGDEKKKGRKYISRVERYKIMPDSKTASVIALVLNIEEEDLFGPRISPDPELFVDEPLVALEQRGENIYPLTPDWHRTLEEVEEVDPLFELAQRVDPDEIQDLLRKAVKSRFPKRMEEVVGMASIFSFHPYHLHEILGKARDVLYLRLGDPEVGLRRYSREEISKTLSLSLEEVEELQAVALDYIRVLLQLTIAIKNLPQ